MSVNCAKPGCDRMAPRGAPKATGSDRFCTRHDGLTYGRGGICVCDLAVAGADGQCKMCSHPIVRLHARLTSLLERIPWLANQEVMAA